MFISHSYDTISYMLVTHCSFYTYMRKNKLNNNTYLGKYLKAALNEYEAALVTLLHCHLD